jgi:hypothetical protein
MKSNSKKGRPSKISEADRERLMESKGLGSERWALDHRFIEVTLAVLKDEPYPFIMPAGKKPRTSLLVELGRWENVRFIKQIASQLEEIASQNKELTIKQAISISRKTRLELKEEMAGHLFDTESVPILT